jgi:Transglycosylase SLT domain
MKSLGDIFRDALHHHADRESPSHSHNEESPYLLLGQKTTAPQAAAATPSRQEVLNYLGQLADDYHIPRKLVYSVADAESGVNPEALPHPNYLKRNGKIVHKDGTPVIKNWDYGMMQVNSSDINKGDVKDAHGHAFKIGEDVKSDWRANARAGVALLAPAYKFAEWEQPPGSTAEDRAQQAYSQYNGTPQTRDRYLKQGRDGLPQNGADRNFLGKYRRW